MTYSTEMAWIRHALKCREIVCSLRRHGWPSSSGPDVVGDKRFLRRSTERGFPSTTIWRDHAPFVQLEGLNTHEAPTSVVPKTETTWLHCPGGYADNDAT